jgi:hypothetical protein
MKQPFFVDTGSFLDLQIRLNIYFIKQLRTYSK